ncbi:MAG: M14 family zinc carboxypeptidase [Rhodothermales bacterium]
MIHTARFCRLVFMTIAFWVFLQSLPVFAQTSTIPKPSDVFGFEPGDDYKLANYTQITDYFQQLDAATDRAEMIQIGTSVLGKPLFVMFISDQANLKKLENYRSISEKLARARIDDETAQKLAAEGKAIVWIDGGMHASERAHGQMTPALAYRLITEESAEMREIRDKVIVLLMPNINPDGLDIVTSWYNKYLGTPFETTGPAWLYHHYVGHDNNRDWFMNNMPESEAVSQVLYNEWYPQIIHNHHQTSPAWARIFLPPFSDPVNPNIHPGVTTGVNLVGTAMANRFAMKRMPGVISDFQYSMWWNGGMRTAPYFHNMIGILTETAHATPTPRTYDPKSKPATLGSRRSSTPTNGTDVFYPYPWEGGESRFGDAVDYMITASMGILSIAADRKEKWLYNIYSMGRDAMESSDYYAYIVPKEQWDHSESYRLIDVLRKTGIEVHQAKKAFIAGGSEYAAGSFVIKSDQAFAPMLTDLMEPQSYPDRRFEDGAPQVPYDLAGWTLPLQMGVEVKRIVAPFKASLNEVTETDVPRAAGTITSSGSPESNFGYILSHNQNASIEASNQLLASGDRVFWTSEELSVHGKTYPPGSIVIEKSENTAQRVQRIAETLGLSFDGILEEPKDVLHELQSPRIALYKSWVANMDEGWTRWLMENYAFPIDTLHDVDINTASLEKYHAIILPSQQANRMLNGHPEQTMPAEYTGGLGLEGALALKNYVASGGTLIALDAASDFAIEQFGLPVRNVVKGQAPEQFFIPGSLIRTSINTQHPLAFGMQEETAVSFQRSRAFEVVQIDRRGEGGEEDIEKAQMPDVQVVASYAEEDLLMSGWALGEEKHIGGKAAMLNIPMGDGNVVLFGFRPQFRGQPGSTYKLLFNALHAATLDQLPAFNEKGNALPTPK